MGFSMRAYWGGLPCPPPGDLPDPGIKPVPLTSPASEGGFFVTSPTWEAPWCMRGYTVLKIIDETCVQKLWKTANQVNLT